jgi:CelD/BcsL family acetyltransferase involved in cellulose biosynthesis
MLTTRVITTTADLAALAVPWNILAAGAPMRSWYWLATWWKHYGTSANRELHVLAVYDDAESGSESLVGIAPWYIERSRLFGSVLRPLGDGEVCTDHLSLLVRPDYVASVVATVAEYLSSDDEWDQLELLAIDEGDCAIELLIAELESTGSLVSPERAGNCWVIDLPETWEQYLAAVSQSHRRQLRKCYEQKVGSSRVQWHTVTDHGELETAWNILIDLHQRRRSGLGEPGCFASPRFNSFHREVVEQFFSTQQLRLSWIELDGSPFTAEYHFSSPDTVFSYQSGMDTSRLDESPGRLSYLLSLQKAINEGFTHFDFLRGDEPYKAHFRGEARPIYDYHVFPSRQLARLRGRLMSAASTVKDWMKQGVVAVKS